MWDWIEQYEEPIKEALREKVLEKSYMPMRPVNPLILQRLFRQYSYVGVLQHGHEKQVHKVTERSLWNIAKLNANTILAGHTQTNPEEYFDLTVKQVEDWHDAWYDPQYFQFSDFDCQVPISDYGLNPLLELATEAIATSDATARLLIMNRILNVWHMRSDLSEIFVKGGSKVLDMLNEDVTICFGDTNGD